MPQRPLEMPFTLIIPVHGRTDVLIRALLSVVQQQIHPQEVIIVDDGSPEPTEIPRCISDRLRIRVIRHEQNLGPAAARNSGMRAAKTDWMTFLDSDDFLLPGTLRERWRMIEAEQATHPSGETIYGCGWIDVDPAGTLIAARRPRPSDNADDFASACWFAPGSCVFLNGAHATRLAGFQDEISAGSRISTGFWLSRCTVSS